MDEKYDCDEPIRLTPEAQLDAASKLLSTIDGIFGVHNDNLKPLLETANGEAPVSSSSSSQRDIILHLSLCLNMTR